MDTILKEIYDMDSAEMERCSKHIMLGGGTLGGPVLVKGKGVRVWDHNGKDYIDCTSQSWALYLGYANDEINQVIKEHIDNMTHIHQGFDTKARYYIANKLAKLAPGDLNRVSFTAGGGLAIESAMKISIKNVQPSRDFVCLYDSWHGTTLASMGASWVSTKSNGKYMAGSRFLPLTRPFVRIPNADQYRNPYNVDAETYIDICLTIARETFTRGIAGKPAGVIVEPLQGSGGQIILPKRYLQELRKLCDEFETLLIYDEIQTFARIGEMFAADYFGVTPDIMVLGKGIGAGLPMNCIIISDKLEGLSTDGEDLHTFANPTLSFVAAAKQIAILESGVLENCRKMGKYLGDKIRDMMHEFPEIGDVRQAGLHIGVEFVKDPLTKEPIPEETKAIRVAGLKNGIIFGLGGARVNVLKVKPPLIVNKEECDEILDKFRKTVNDVLRK